MKKITKKEAERIAAQFAAWSLRRALRGGALDRFIAEKAYAFEERTKIDNAAALLEDTLWNRGGYTLAFPVGIGRALAPEESEENYEARRNRSDRAKEFDRAKAEADKDADALRAACAPRVAAVRRAITSPPAPACICDRCANRSPYGCQYQQSPQQKSCAAFTEKRN